MFLRGLDILRRQRAQAGVRQRHFRRAVQGILHGFDELRLTFVVALLLAQELAVVVQCHRVAGRAVERGLEARFRLVVLLEPVAQQAKRVVRIGVPGIDFERFFQLFQREFVVAVLHVLDAELSVERGHFGALLAGGIRFPGRGGLAARDQHAGQQQRAKSARRG